MAKIKLDDLDRLSAEFESKKAALSSEIETLLKREAALSAAAQRAADEGVVDAFMQKTKARERTSAELYVKRTQADKLRKPFTADDVTAAIADYTESHNREMQKKLAAYQGARDKLLLQFAEIVKLQNDYLGKREKAVSLCEDNVNLSGISVEWIPPEQESYNVKPSALPFPDARLILSRAKGSEQEIVNLLLFLKSVLIGHTYHIIPHII